MSQWRLVLKAQTLVVIAALVSCLLDTARAAEGGKADIVLRNGKIYTADPARSIQQAIAFKGNTILAVGDDNDVTPLIGSETKVVDLGGKLVLPGLIDTHIHPIIGAVNGAKCSLAGVKATIDALKPVIQDCLANYQGGADDWFEAAQLDNYGFSATAKDLDTIESSRPVALWGNDGHTAWVNSRGLALLGVTAETPDISGGKIGRDATGAPNGYFADRAAVFVSEKIPEPPLEERVALTAAELKRMSASGLTALMDAFVTPGEAAVWRLCTTPADSPCAFAWRSMSLIRATIATKPWRVSWRQARRWTSIRTFCAPAWSRCSPTVSWNTRRCRHQVRRQGTAAAQYR